MNPTDSLGSSQGRSAYSVLAGLPAGDQGGSVPVDTHTEAIVGNGESARFRRKLQSGRWLILEDAARGVAGELASEGIRAWGYKGVDYARTLYPDPSLRPMSDLDIIVERTDMLGAAGILRGAGWLEISPGYPMVSSGVVSSILYLKNGIPLDVHSHPAYFPSTVPGRLPHPSSLECTQTQSGLLSPPDPYRLLLSLLHMIRHGRIRSIWWVDAALLSSRLDGAGWERFAFLASRTGLSRRIEPLVSILGGFPGISVPEGVGRSLSDGPDRSLPFRIAGLGRGGPTLAASMTLKGWRRTSFVAVLIMRLITGRPAAVPQPDHGGAGDETGLG